MELQEGIIVKTINYLDSSKIVYVLTKEGLQSYIVHGSKKLKSKNYSYSQELQKIAFDVKKNKIIGSGKILNNYVTIKSDVSRLFAILKISEIIYELGNHINNCELFYDFSCEIFDIINNSSKDYKLFQLVFEIKTLYLLGVAPVFLKCVSCGSSSNLVGFVFNSGGYKCSNCLSENEFIYPQHVIELVKTLYLTKLNQIDIKITDNEYDKVERFTQLYYENYLGFKSKVEKVKKTTL